jgi:hypothetical protein
MQDQTETIVRAFEGWLASLPSGVARVRRLDIPAADDYALRALFRVEPSKPTACPLELGVTAPDAGSTVALSLDTWAALAKRLDCDVSIKNAEMIGLFIEATTMTVEQTMRACTAVANGSVRLSAGLVRGRLTCTRGWLETPSGQIRMHGPEEYLFPLVRALARLRVGSVRGVLYDPWT